MNLILPQHLSVDTLNSFPTFPQDASTDAIAFAFVAQRTTAIKKFEVHIGTKTGTPHDLLVFLAADNNNQPAGAAGAQPTDIGGGSPTLVSVANASVSAGVNQFTFTNAYAPTVGTKYWVVLWPGSSGGSAWSASHRYIYTVGTLNFTTSRGERAATTTDTATTWTQNEQGIYSFSLLDASDNYLPLRHSAVFANTTNAVTPTSASSPNEYGTLLTLPANQAAKLHAIQWYYRIASATTSDSQLEVWTDPLGTPVSLENFAVDVSAYYPVTGAARPFIHQLLGSGPYSLAGGTVLGVSNRATGAGTVTTFQVQFTSQAAKEAALWLRDWYGIDRAGGSGAFTARPDRIYSVLPLLSLESPGVQLVIPRTILR